MHQYSQYPDESLYIAGPECFYTGGSNSLAAMRKESEFYGFQVALPNDKKLDWSDNEPRDNARSIFQNCADSMAVSTAILADLESFRGTEPDGGTIYEIGMAYARGLRCYAYTRDLRPVVHKYQRAALKEDGKVYDLDGRVLPHMDIPFAPCIVGSCKIVEGKYTDCLKALRTDLDEERKHKAKRQTPAVDHSAEVTLEKGDKPVVYLAGPERYDPDAAEKYAAMKKLCEERGLVAITPLDAAPGVAEVESDDPYTKAYNLFDRWQQHVRNCDIIIADLSDYHGFEPNSDVAFECGMAWQLGKKCFAYMHDATWMRQRIAHYGEDKDNRDIYGNDVENFNYPVNLMFSGSMPVYGGKFEEIIDQVMEELNK